LAIGYLGLATTLSGVLQIGTLNVPVPAGSTGSYAVQLTNISAGDLAGNPVTLTGVNGAITLGVVEPTNTPTQSGASTPTNTLVPVSTSTPTATTAAAATSTATKPPTATATKAAPTATPTATATVTIHHVTLSAAISATDNQIAVVDATGIHVGDTVQVDNEQMRVTAIAGNDLTVTRGVNGTTAVAHAAGTAGFEEEGGCQIGTQAGGSGWLLLIPAIGLLVMRRRRG
ncbi:MAG: hypothetical protein ACHQ4J_16390, partial [Candidatus Binatia bacterium]